MFNASTRRAIRTGFDVTLGVLAVAAIVVPSLNQFGVPTDHEAALLAYTVAATALVSKVRNKLEDLGWLPAPLKHDAETDDSHDHYDEGYDSDYDGRDNGTNNGTERFSSGWDR